jgi:signal transduction histidine kinase
MTARTSLERRLVIAVVAVLALALAGFSVLLHAAFRDSLVREFDARLEDDAQGVADMVEQHEDGSLELEGSLSDFERSHGLGYLEAWADDGSVLARSPGLGARDLPRDRSAGATEVTLPDGRRGRLYVTDRVPRRDDEEGQTRPSQNVRIAVARDTDEVDAAIAVLRRLLGLAGMSVLALSGGAAAIAIRRGFVPVHALAAKLERIDAERLGERVPTDGVPAELAKLVDKLNELLARLETAFARERQFTSDASHELRTPMAAIRSILEVALSRERAPSDYQTSLREALAVAVQTSGLVEQLLLLARVDARAVTVAREPVSLRELAAQGFGPLTAAARERKLSFENRIPEGAIVASDPEKLGVVAANLLGNAVQYASEGGIVRVRAAPEEGLVLEVENTGPALPESELERIFERFVRLDTSRSAAAQHAGIGLSLVRALCTVLGFDVKARNAGDGWVSFRVEGKR